MPSDSRFVAAKLAQEMVDASSTDAPERLLVPVSLAADRQNQFLFFFKPECFQLPDRAQQLDLVETALGILGTFNVEITGAVVVSGHRLKELSLMDRHYGYINTMSRQASSLLSLDSKVAIRRIAGAPDDAIVIGGHEALARWPLFSPQSLGKLWATRRSPRVRSGLYAELHDVEGSPVVIINGFHPKQLAHFNDPGKNTAFLIAQSDVPWRVLRRCMLGDTFPEQAACGSIRRVIWEQAQRLGFGSVDISNNCVHMSAGPFEAISEINNFFSSVGSSDFSLDACRQAEHLRSAGWEGDVLPLLANALACLGPSKVALFDATEETDGCAAAWLATMFWAG